jgi:hypothetical protein
MPRSIGDGIWVIDHPMRMGGAIEMGTRSTLVRLADDSLLLHSPGPLTDAQLEGVRALGAGRVSTLVAPNAFHHLFLADALRAFPEADLHAVPSIQTRFPDVASQTLGETPNAAWQGVLEQLAVVGAPRLDEVVFFHRASRTLLLVDLCFNMQHAANWLTRIFLHVAGAYGHFGPSRLARSMFKDKAAVRASVDRILEWDFDRAVVTHGEVVETGAREAMRKSFAWL